MGGSGCQTLIGNRPTYFRHAALIQGDIRNTPTGMLLRESGLRVGECGVVIGGPPCQGYSTSGKRQPDDPRKRLVFEFLRVVRDAKPHFFIFENVPGFITLSQGDFMRRFLKEAHDAYYELVYGVVDCAEYGVPQRRVRFVCTGTPACLPKISRPSRCRPVPYGNTPPAGVGGSPCR